MKQEPHPSPLTPHPSPLTPHPGRKISTRYTAKCCEPHCWMRECMWPGEDKGSFVRGRGYTSYYKTPIPECMTRHLHGCPHPLPVPDPEHARCCYAPVYKGRRKVRTCETCGAEAPSRYCKALNDLPRLPGVPCKHTKQKNCIVTGWRECPACRGFWAARNGVSPHEVPTHTFDEMLAELERRLNRGSGTPPKE